MGLFVAIEGGDGSGKGTQSKLLADYLTQIGKKVHSLTFPRYGNGSAYYVEKYLNGAYGSADEVHADLGVLAFAIDRFAASEDLKKKLSEQDSIVIADRYMASNLAHQGTKIKEPNESRKEFYERSMHTEYDILGIPRPDMNIVLIMPSELAQLNVDKKEKRSYTELKRDIHEADAEHLDKAKANYEELCQLYPHEYTAVLCTDESGAMRPIEDIQTEIRNIIGDGEGQSTG